MQKIENTQQRHRRWQLSLLELVRANPGISRTELKTISGLSMESVLKLVEELLNMHLITDCGIRQTAKAGRRASGLQINADGCCFIGVRFSADKVDCACTDFSHRLLHQWSSDLPQDCDADKMLTVITEGISFLLNELGDKRASVSGIGIGAPGLIDPVSGVILRYVHVKGCENWPLRKLLQERFCYPVYLEHGVKCSAASYFRQDENRDTQDALFVQVGRGVNMCILSHGRILNGARYLSGEIGHMPVSLSHYRCSCGRTGCLETVAGSAALHALVRRGIADNEQSFPRLQSLLRDGASLQTGTVIQAAASGDEDCTRLLEQVGQAMGTALAAAVMLTNPSQIILCSKLSDCDTFIRSFETALTANTFPESMYGMTLRYLRFYPMADAVGASLLPYRALYEMV